jgi:O-acetyl-ADP-ribose deacetylase (regulator of RNase III)
MANPIELNEIPTLTLLYATNRLSPSSNPKPNANSKHNDKISLIRHDITKLKTSAIVNAANESLMGGGGVDGAIHRAAGPDLLDECETLDGCDTGDAKITDAYELPCDKVIHAVGPVYYSTKRKGMHTQLLQSCYTTSLDLAAQNGCTSIAFSALSTGVYGYPSEEAAETAIAAVKGWLDADEERSAKMERIVFCSFLAKDERAYEKFIPWVSTLPFGNGET